MNDVSAASAEGGACTILSDEVNNRPWALDDLYRSG